MTISVTTRGVTNGACTSTTRPENPAVGQIIFETDTKLQRVWLGSSWSDGYLHASLVVEYLVLAGGGGGGSDLGGGGGAGGYITGSLSSPTLGVAYTVTVGSGGAQNVAGQNSVFSTINMPGGGAGRANASSASLDGGSGAGVHATGVPGLATAPSFGGLGFGGGTGVSTGGGGSSSGGGGGAGGIGGNGIVSVGGNGGLGVSSSITGSSLFYAGGGGGGVWGGTGGTGGSSIGGAGGSTTSGFNASPANRGSGGGGAADANRGGGSGSGGVVIIAYQDIFSEALTTGSPTVSTVSRAGYRVYTFTGSGTITFQ